MELAEVEENVWDRQLEYIYVRHSSHFLHLPRGIFGGTTITYKHLKEKLNREQISSFLD